ncbi:MAG: response regulator transcription factor [Campylobacterales bacterium]|nr:response regulator transcription factor [Campylobacterales bacterium]
MFKILVVEDDELFAESLEDFLSENEFEISLAKSSKEAIEFTYKHRYDLYLLDINIPDMNGIELLKELRCANDLTPTFFLTSYNDKEFIKRGFLAGCDDYLKKPFDLDELLFKINALFSRLNKKNLFIIDNYFSFDMSLKRLYKDGIDLDISPKELLLLHELIINKNSVVTKEMIMSTLWQNDDSSEGSLRVYINNLKKILGREIIENIRGVGYRFKL